MSKLDTELLSKAVEKILAFSRGEEVDGKQGKKRNFVETIDLQVCVLTCLMGIIPDEGAYSV